MTRTSLLPAVLTASATRTQIVSMTFLVSVLSAFQSSTLCTVEAETVAGLKKTGNPFGTVYKQSRFQAFVAFDYRDAVNAQRGREGTAATFTPSPRQWGRHLTDADGTPLPFIAHTPKGADAPKLYVQLRILRSLAHVYRTADGTVLTDEQVAPFLPAHSDNSAHQGVEKEIPVRDYGMEGIWSVAVAGMRFVVDPSTVAPGMAEVASLLAVNPAPVEIPADAETLALA